MPFRPMLAGKADLKHLIFPVLVTPKLDGIRTVCMDGKALSRTLKPIPNLSIQRWFKNNADLLEGMDGELIVGNPTANDVYRVTNSAVMSEDGEPQFTLYVFDYVHNGDLPFYARHDVITARFKDATGTWEGNGVARVLTHRSVRSIEELNDYEKSVLDAGYEGVMLRHPSAPYKQGRSSTREGYLLKLKRFCDAEAEIIGFEERMHNANEATRDERGYTKRSSHQENQVGTESLGAFVVRGIGEFEGVEFKIGTGLDESNRLAYWVCKDDLLGKRLKYKFFDVGVKDAPRHPVFLGFRDTIDS